MRLQNFISEKFQFANAKDQDYPMKNSGVMFFDKQDEYKVKGKAHNLASHAIKHLRDLKRNEYYNIINDILSYIETIDYTSQANKINSGTVINTLDRINDKIHFNEKLTKEEEIIKSYIEKLENIYRSMAANFTRYYITSENIKNNENIFSLDKVVKFKVLEKGTDKPSTHYLNFKTLNFAVQRNDKIRSFYPLDSKKEILGKYKKNKILSDKLNRLLYGE